MKGGYEDGYEACSCFWGIAPGSLVVLLQEYVSNFKDMRILDLGCGEGKNAAYLANLGAHVDAIDISEKALENGKKLWSGISSINWSCSDLRQRDLLKTYHIIIAYGLMHCLSSPEEALQTINEIKAQTLSGGYNIICAFNDRKQDLIAHPGFKPLLLPHKFYQDAYADWECISSSDRDLEEAHPHNKIMHTHSMSRLLMRKKHD